MPPPTTTHHYPPPAKIYPPPAKIYPPPPTKSQNLFFKKPIYKNLSPLSDGNVRNLNSRPAIAKKLFYIWPATLFLLHTPETVLKSCRVSEISLVLKKDKCLSVENIQKKNNRIDNIDNVIFNFHAVFSNSDRKSMFRSSHRMCSVTKRVLRNFSKFTGKHLCQILFFNKVAGLLFNKVAGLKPATF